MDKFTSTSTADIITVTFKEKYMSHPVTRTCLNMTRQQVIDTYGLREPDIEWFRFID